MLRLRQSMPPDHPAEDELNQFKILTTDLIYDKFDNMVEQRDIPEPDEPETYPATSFAYDCRGLMTNETLLQGAIPTFSYNPWGLKTEQISDAAGNLSVDPNDYYYAHNHLFSSVALMEDDGTVVERYEYDAYGKPTIMDDSYCGGASDLEDEWYQETLEKIERVIGEKLDQDVMNLYANSNTDPCDLTFIITEKKKDCTLNISYTGLKACTTGLDWCKSRWEPHACEEKWDRSSLEVDLSPSALFKITKFVGCLMKPQFIKDL